MITIGYFFTHIIIKSRTNRGYKLRSTIRRITIIISIPVVFYSSHPISYDTDYSSISKPLTYLCKVIITISRSTFMIILSLPCCKNHIPVLSGFIESTIERKRLSSSSCTLCIIPAEPSISNLVHINSWDRFQNSITYLRNRIHDLWWYRYFERRLKIKNWSNCL